MNQDKQISGIGGRADRDSRPSTGGEGRRSGVTFRRQGAVLISALGVLLAFGGSATAGTLITGKQIKDNTIKSVDLRDGRILGADVRDGALTRADFGALPAGPRGPQGEPGAPGLLGVGLLVGLEQTMTVHPGTTKTVEVFCPAGSVVVGGGLVDDGLYTFLLRINRSGPTSGGWVATVTNEGFLTTNAQVTAKVACAAPGYPEA